MQAGGHIEGEYWRDERPALRVDAPDGMCNAHPQVTPTSGTGLRLEKKLALKPQFMVGFIGGHLANTSVLFLLLAGITVSVLMLIGLRLRCAKYIILYLCIYGGVQANDIG